MSCSFLLTCLSSSYSAFSTPQPTHHPHFSLSLFALSPTVQSCNVRCMNGGSCAEDSCFCTKGYTGSHCGQREWKLLQSQHTLMWMCVYVALVACLYACAWQLLQCVVSKAAYFQRDRKSANCLHFHRFSLFFCLYVWTSQVYNSKTKSWI